MTHADRMAAFEAERKLITIEEQSRELKDKIETFKKEKEIFKAEKDKYIANMEILNKFLIDNNLSIKDGKVCTIDTSKKDMDSEENKGNESKEEDTSKKDTLVLPEDIDSYTKKSLLEYCKKGGIEVNETLTKDEILTYLKLEK